MPEEQCGSPTLLIPSLFSFPISIRGKKRRNRSWTLVNSNKEPTSGDSFLLTQKLGFHVKALK
jgi:hypothetical protein